MKTKLSAREIVRVRVVLTCLALVTIAGIEFGLSESLAARIGQITGSRMDGPQTLNVNISDFMVAAR